MPRAAAIYVRISDDRDGAAAGVQRQEKDCRALCEQRGWPVVEVYADNDFSAYSGKRRPAWERLLNDIKQGRIDAVAVWHLDRLTRRPIELERFFEVCDAAGVRDFGTCSGDIDLATHDGQFLARILAAAARKESDDKSRRTRRKHLEIAEAGRPVGGTRPFGYNPDKVTIRQGEAERIRDAARRVLAGESLRSLCIEWNRDGVETPRGGRWTQTAIRRILTSPRLIGMRSLDGVVVAKAVWPPILDEDTHHRLVSLLTAPGRSRGGYGPRRYVLTGLLFCGKCGKRLIARPGRNRARTYVCTNNPDLGGCGGIRVVAEPLEGEVAARLFAVVSGDLVAQAVDGERRDEELSQLLVTISDLERRLDQVAVDYTDGILSKGQLTAANQHLNGRLDALRRRVAVEQRSRTRDAWRSGNDRLEALWDDLELLQRRAVLDAWIDRIVIHPQKTKRGRFDPDRVEVFWRA